MNGNETHYYPMHESMEVQGYEIHNTTFHFCGGGIILIAQKNPTAESESGRQEVYLSRDHVIALATLLKQRERAGLFN
jgi:hypothetical protein